MTNVPDARELCEIMAASFEIGYPDELPPEITEYDPGPYEPTEADWSEYEDYLERLEYERGCDAWIVRPIEKGGTQ